MKETSTVAEGLAALGVIDRLVCAHASMRSFVERLPAVQLTEALLDAGCTTFAPAFTYAFERQPPSGQRPERNGMDYALLAAEGEPVTASTPRFDPGRNALSREDMGAFPAALLATPGRIRGNHPLNSFVATGPRAQQVMALQDALDVYGPFRELLAQDGVLLMLGTTLESLTFIHYCEHGAGRKGFIRWALDPAGRTIPCITGGCSSGFGKLAPVVEPVLTRVLVRGSTWTCLPARATYRALVAAIREQPELTTCGRPTCLRCRDGLLGGPDPLDAIL